MLKIQYVSLLLVVALLFFIGLRDGHTIEKSPRGISRYHHAYALLIGSNRAGVNQQPLRYAHSDAQNIASVLTQIGGYPSRQIETLIDPSSSKIIERLHQIGTRIERHSKDGERSALFFYYSGHARARSLTLGEDELRLSRIREALDIIPADVKIVVLDACQTGAYSRIKGARLDADFSYNSIALLQTSGTAVMASSAADELSQESDELKGSFFTHHLVVGLRGAADLDTDGRVSLFEAYEYAYNRTLISTAGTAVGPQHVTLETDLKGKGEMILSWPENAQAKLQLPEELEAKVIIYDTDSHQVQAEVTKAKGADVTLAFPPGSYAAILNQSEGQFRCPLILEEQATTVLDLSSCTPFETSVVTVKADALPEKLEQTTETEQSEKDMGETLDPKPEAEKKSEPQPQIKIEIEKAARLKEKKKIFIWSPFLEASIGMLINRNDDDFHRELKVFNYSLWQGDETQLYWAVTAGVSITRYIGLAFLYSSLDKCSYETEAYDSLSEDHVKTSISWSSFRLGGEVRGGYPLFHGWLTPFVTLGLGGVHISKKTTFEYDHFDYRDGAYEPFHSIGESNNYFWHLSVFGGFGLTVKVYRILGFVTQAEYIYAPGLRASGNEHNHGGWSLSVGIRCAMWDGLQ